MTRLGPTFRRFLLATLAAALLGALPPAVAVAGTITPTDGVDEFNTNASHCSLREAIQAAQGTGAFNGCSIGSDTDADTIALQSGTTYSLNLPGVENLNSGGDLDVVGQAGDNYLTINTTGPGRATIDASGAGDRVLDIAPNGAPSYIVQFTLSNVELTGGNAGANDSGGLKAGYMTSLVVNSAYVHGNTAGDGGAMRIDAGFASFTDSRIEDNTATGGFGGLWLESADPVTFSNTTIAHNHALGGIGGGIAISSNTFPDVTLTNSTVYGNDAATDGGGIYSTADPLAMNPGVLTLSSSTIAGNHADFDNNGSGNGGGLYMLGTASSISRNSIIGDNTDAGGEAPDCSGNLTSQGYNLFESILGCSVTLNNDVIGDPKLGALGIDPVGVPVPVLPLLPGSPALNAGNPLATGGSAPACPAADQRGDSRGSAFVDNCDIGAFEYQAHDTDFDQYPDNADNCPNVINPTQANTKGGTAAGDACEDQDSDGVLDAADNCATQSGPASNGGCPLPVQPPPAGAGPGATGQRAAALKKCKKKKGAARKKCKKKANKLPV
jgi:CSLREA domain-containing protein